MINQNSLEVWTDGPWYDMPKMFTNSELADTLEQDQIFWVCQYTMPHKFRAVLKSNGREIDIRRDCWVDVDPSEYEMVRCGFECLIKFTKSDGTFKKVLRPMGA